MPDNEGVKSLRSFKDNQAISQESGGSGGSVEHVFIHHRAHSGLPRTQAMRNGDLGKESAVYNVSHSTTLNYL